MRNRGAAGLPSLSLFQICPVLVGGGCPLVTSPQTSGFEMDATPQDIQESIEQLVAYRDRLRQDVIAMGQKLKLPQAKIDRTLADHPELTRLEEVLGQLQSQLAQPQG